MPFGFSVGGHQKGINPHSWWMLLEQRGQARPLQTYEGPHFTGSSVAVIKAGVYQSPTQIGFQAFKSFILQPGWGLVFGTGRAGEPGSRSHYKRYLVHTISRLLARQTKFTKPFLCSMSSGSLAIFIVCWKSFT